MTYCTLGSAKEARETMSDAPTERELTADELQAKLDLLYEQGAVIAAKEAELEAAKAEADAKPAPALPVLPELTAAVQVYREHGRLGEEGGV